MNAHERHLFGCFGLAFAACVVFGALLVVVAFVVAPPEDRDSPPGTLGDARRGCVLVDRYGCTACHEAYVAPPFDRMAARSYIAGRFPNIPIVMTEWIRHPQAMKPGTAMPDLGVSQRDARDMTAYLATLR